MTATDSERSFRSKFFFWQQSGVGMIILKTDRSFLITPEFNGNSSRRPGRKFSLLRLILEKHLERETFTQK